MDGTAIMQGVATVFICQVYGSPLTINQMMMVVLTATLASVGTAGVLGVSANNAFYGFTASRSSGRRNIISYWDR